MGMTLKELLTKGEGTLSAQEAKALASQCRMDVETLYTLLEERGIKVLDNEAEEDASLDVPALYPEHHLRRWSDEGHPEITPSPSVKMCLEHKRSTSWKKILLSSGAIAPARRS